MNIASVGFTRFTAAACATAITMVGAWAFVSASASLERDPYHFAAIMAANANAHEARAAQLQARNTVPTCLGESLSADAPVSSQTLVCQHG